MAQIGYHISKGLPLWGFSVRQGTVLYLALEDDYARLQKRLSQMFGMEGSENFYFATKSKSYKMSRPNVQKILYKNVQLVCLF